MHVQAALARCVARLTYDTYYDTTPCNTDIPCNPHRELSDYGP
jgi:hypothetical protein